MNKVFLRGNSGQDARITNFEDGGKVAQFSLATTERGFKTRDGREVQDVTDWHNIVVRKSGLAEVCEKFVKKGTPLLICGKLRTRSYQGRDGVDRSITEVVCEEMELLGGNRQRDAAPAPEPEYKPAAKEDNGDIPEWMQ